MSDKPNGMSNIESLFKLTQGQILNDPLYDMLSKREQDYLRMLAASELEKRQSDDLEFRKQVNENGKKGRGVDFLIALIFIIIGYIALY